MPGTRPRFVRSQHSSSASVYLWCQNLAGYPAISTVDAAVDDLGSGLQRLVLGSLLLHLERSPSRSTPSPSVSLIQMRTVVSEHVPLRSLSTCSFPSFFHSPGHVALPAPVDGDC